MSSAELRAADALERLAAQANERQREVQTTAISLDHLPPACRTVRETVSIIIATKSYPGGPHFVFHREPVPQKDSAAPKRYRMAVFGGGLESREEERVRKTLERDPLIVDPALLTEAGEIPDDLWYRLQGKNFLRQGLLFQAHYPLTPGNLRAVLREDMVRRLQAEAGKNVLPHIADPELLFEANPVVTHVLNRRLGAYTEHIAAKEGMEVNERGELKGIGITVRERFALAQLFVSPEYFVKQAKGAAVAVSADELVAQAEEETKDSASWHARNEKPLPIRNASLLVGAAAAAHALGTAPWRRMVEKILSRFRWPVRG